MTHEQTAVALARMCSFPGCEKPQKARGLCPGHLYQDSKGRDLTPIFRNEAERFWAKVAKTEGCWLWTGATTGRGYGSFRVGGKTRGAHQVAWEWLRGQVGAGKVLDHKCQVKNCVNPEHLQEVSNKENLENFPSRTASVSGFRGVSFDARLGKWVSHVTHNGTTFYAGRYATVEEAHLAAVELRNKLFTNNLEDRGLNS